VTATGRIVVPDLPAPSPTDERAGRRADRTQRAVAAAVAVAREHRLRVDEPGYIRRFVSRISS
jgi:hypothetical protein